MACGCASAALTCAGDLRTWQPGGSSAAECDIAVPVVRALWALAATAFAVPLGLSLAHLARLACARRGGASASSWRRKSVTLLVSVASGCGLALSVLKTALPAEDFAVGTHPAASALFAATVSLALCAGLVEFAFFVRTLGQSQLMSAQLRSAALHACAFVGTALCVAASLAPLFAARDSLVPFALSGAGLFALVPTLALPLAARTELAALAALSPPAFAARLSDVRRWVGRAAVPNAAILCVAAPLSVALAASPDARAAAVVYVVAAWCIAAAVFLSFFLRLFGPLARGAAKTSAPSSSQGEQSTEAPHLALHATPKRYLRRPPRQRPQLATIPSTEPPRRRSALGGRVTASAVNYV